MVAITRKGNTMMARLYESEERRTKVRTKRNRATAMKPERIGDSAHEATIAETPCSFLFLKGEFKLTHSSSEREKKKTRSEAQKQAIADIKKDERVDGHDV